MKNYEEMAKCVLEARDRHINKKKIRQAKIKKYALVVSRFCFAVLLGFGVWHGMSGLLHIPYQQDTAVPDEAPNTNPNPLHWNEMTINQQYNMAEFGEPLAFYHTAEKDVAAEQIGDFICMAYMSGYDFYSDTYYHCDAKAYKIKNDESSMIAIKFDNDEKFYLYYLTVPNQNQELDE